MSQFGRLLLVSFLESASTVLFERGIFFYTKEYLGSSDVENLVLALVFGVAYIAGALQSHSLCVRLGEKRVVVAGIAGQGAVLLAVVVYPGLWVIHAVNFALGWLNGIKWPPIESYVAAGQTPAETAKLLGRYNVTWALAVPLAVGMSGPLIEVWDRGLFAPAVVFSAASLWLLKPLSPRPTHLAADHPERPDPARLARIRSLLVASRWLLFSSYALLWILSALIPGVLRAIGHETGVATLLWAIIDVVRVLSFFALGRSNAWHDRSWPLLLALAGVPAGFFLMLGGSSSAEVLAGEIVFGVAAGIAYFAALYYALVVKNAAVDAGGVHEGLIGLGFAVGPVVALGGAHVGSVLEISPSAGAALGVLPILVVSSAGTLRALLSMPRR